LALLGATEGAGPVLEANGLDREVIAGTEVATNGLHVSEANNAVDKTHNGTSVKRDDD
jgi:hypothetical protein